jgi:hypothetical protein
MAKEPSNVMVLYGCLFTPNLNFIETIDLSYLSLQVTQTGFHSLNLQPSNKPASPDKVDSWIIFKNLALLRNKVLCMNCLQCNVSLVFFQNLWYIPCSQNKETSGHYGNAWQGEDNVSAHNVSSFLFFGTYYHELSSFACLLLIYYCITI